MKIAKVCIDDPRDGFEFIVPPTDAYIAKERWNGWIMPYFTRQNADAVMTAWNANGEKSTDDMKDSTMRYDAEEDAYIVHWPEANEGETYEGEDVEIDGQTVHLYAIGACAWTWDLEPEAENEADTIMDADELSDPFYHNTNPKFSEGKQ